MKTETQRRQKEKKELAEIKRLRKYNVRKQKKTTSLPPSSRNQSVKVKSVCLSRPIISKMPKSCKHNLIFNLEIDGHEVKLKDDSTIETN